MNLENLLNQLQPSSEKKVDSKPVERKPRKKDPLPKELEHITVVKSMEMYEAVFDTSYNPKRGRRDALTKVWEGLGRMLAR